MRDHGLLVKDIMKCKYDEFEANIILHLSMQVLHNIKSLSRQFDKNEITTEQYIAKKKDYIKIISEFKTKIEEVEND